MKRLIIAAAALTLLAAPAFAQDHHDDHNNTMMMNHDDHHAGNSMMMAAHHDWHKGDHIGADDWNRGERVDYRHYRLSEPPRGYHWVEVNGDYVLAAIATGVIIDTLLTQ